jgi:hypothetical protein
VHWAGKLDLLFDNNEFAWYLGWVVSISRVSKSDGRFSVRMKLVEMVRIVYKGSAEKCRKFENNQHIISKI